MSATLAFLDCETTGLDPDRHEVWDVGLILRDEDGDHEYEWRLPVHLDRADPHALKIGRFHERHRQGHDWLGYLRAESVAYTPPTTGLVEFARQFSKLTRGAHLVGAVISFDEERLRKLLLANGALPEHHYHLVDVEALIAGWFGVQPPWDSNALSCLVGVNPEDFDRHTALGDAKWARALYNAVMAGVRA